jgi:2-methylisocitrate lyase-like PEP mutase family enzyme
MTENHSLQALLDSDDTVWIPGALDCLSAKSLAKEGYDAMYMSGYAVAASRHGVPDIGLLTMTEAVDQTGRLTAATDLPLLVDSAVGNGTPVHVARAVQEIERAGAAGIHITDLQNPARPPWVPGPNRRVGTETITKRIQTAANASDLLVVAGTHVDEDEPDSVWQRIDHYRNAGADAILLSSVDSTWLVEDISEEVSLPILVLGGVEADSESHSAERLAKAGVAAILKPLSDVLAIYGTVDAAYESLTTEGHLRGSFDEMVDFQNILHTLDVEDYESSKYYDLK